MVTIFDAHCDTVKKIVELGGELKSNKYHWDIDQIINQKLKYIQVFAAFVDEKNDNLPPFEMCNLLIDRYFDELRKNENFIEHCNNISDIEIALNNNKIASLLSIEGGEALDGKIENLEFFQKRGVRILTLTWNYPNQICDGIGVETGKGLSLFGKKVVAEANQLRMAIDVSHISEKGFWDVIELSEKPIIASHSNAKAISPHRRNLDDEQIRAIIKNNGCIGINLFSEFLAGKTSTIKDVIRHIDHILSLGGENNIGLGSDFDGISSMPEGLCGVQDVHKIFDEMQKIGYSDLLIEKISYKNFMNILNKISES